MSKLVIVESPTKVKSIKKYLGSGYEVMASMGHIRDLPKSKLGVDVENDFKPQYINMTDKKPLIKSLKEAAANSDGVLLATDPDREGEAISWHLAQILALDMNEANRIAFNEITESGIKAGIASPHKLDLDLVDAQQARRVIDRIVGYKLSPFLWKKVKSGLSAGRVQTVALRLIVEREREIEKFITEEYWSIDAKLMAGRKSFIAKLYGTADGKKITTIPDETTAKAITAALNGAEYIVSNLKKGTRNRQPAPPFITSTLQQEASRKLGFTGQRTMKIAQQLYEGVDIPGVGTTGLITYMRTDSLRVSDEARTAANEYIAEAYGKNYLPPQPRVYKSRASAQDGHEAVRPTIPSLTPAQAKNALSPDQFKLYDLIWKRFLASQMASCLHDTVKAAIFAANEQDRRAGKHYAFSATGYSVKFDGFSRLYVAGTDTEDEEKNEKLPELKEGEALNLKELLPGQHFTQPPPRFTEASLIKTLEESGVGRPSTYASIISTILHRGYVTRQQKMLAPTELGETLTQLLKDRFPGVVNVKFTAQMEDRLDEVGHGKTDYINVLRVFYEDFEATLTKAKAEMEGVKLQLAEDQTDIPCEQCGRMMVIKTGKFGRFLACPGFPDCKNAKPLVVEAKGCCPKCGKTMVQRKAKKTGRVFYGCTGWPDCEFVTWDVPVEDRCPECKKTMFQQRGGALRCEGCGHKEGKR